jgi:hypothetical protein
LESAQQFGTVGSLVRLAPRGRLACSSASPMNAPNHSVTSFRIVFGRDHHAAGHRRRARQPAELVQPRVLADLDSSPAEPAQLGGAAYETGSASCSARTSRTFSTTPGSRWMRSPNDIG